MIYTIEFIAPKPTQNYLFTLILNIANFASFTRRALNKKITIII